VKEWITGRNPVYELLRAGRRDAFRLQVARGAEEKGRLLEILRLAGERGLPVTRVERDSLDRLGEGHQGVALEAGEYPYAGLADILALAHQRGEPLFVLALDMIQNPQNLGTLLRSAEAVGVHGVVIPLARAAGVTPAVVHASVGASEHLLVAQANLALALEEMKKEGDAWVIGLEGGPQAQPYDRVRLDGALVLVVGNEGEGMRQLVRQHCDVLASLPMQGQVESLNAAVAGSILLYRALESRRIGA
jgi:23S rRNA (guanosine2251-2'-O)-methyltransferase